MIIMIIENTKDSNGVDPSGWEEKAQFQREARRCPSGGAEEASMVNRCGKDDADVVGTSRAG
jgi:hypothetical protein